VPPELESRVGFEIELLAPRGLTRADLAHAVATAVGGEVALAFHRDSEPSAVPGMGTFRHLTRGFEVVDTEGRGVCSVVDDVTIVADLDVRAAPVPGWHRIVTDDARLLNLLAQVCDPAAPVEHVLDPVATLFGTEVTRTGGSIYKVTDRDGASVAMAAPLPGERHRPAEIVTAPLEREHGAALDRLLRPAAELGFTVPVEAAVHLHFDAAPFRTPLAFANVVALFSAWREPLRALLGTNPACRRLGPPPPALVELVDTLRGLSSWAEVLGAVSTVELTKFSDVNLLHVIRAPMIKDTLEVRILPGAGSTAQIMARAAAVEGLLQRCTIAPAIPPPGGSVEQDARTLVRWARKEW
jgi:hypothetical protein